MPTQSRRVPYRTLTAGALVAALAGCLGTSAQWPPALPPAGRALSSAGGATAGDLIYVLDNGSERVYQYSYETRKRLATIKAIFYDGLGMCVDAAQHIFVVDNTTQAIREYSHDGKTLVKTLIDFMGFPEACSVDPTTGNLAVTNLENSNDGFPGNVVIFPHVTGNPKSYDVPNMYQIYFPAYDDKGNLFVDGYSTYFASSLLSELPKSGKAFHDLTMSPKIPSVLGMEWDGKFLALCDTHQRPNEIDRFSISGSRATKVSSTILKEDDNAYQFFISAIGGKEVVVATDQVNHKLYAWRYPLGGNPSFSIGGLVRPLGVVISRGMP